MTNAATDGTLLVAVANPSTAERLLDTAIDLAEDRSYELVVTNVVEVPASIPLSNGDSVVDEDAETALERTSELVASAGVPTQTRIRYARDVATGIVGAAAEYDADCLLMGWRGRPPRSGIVLGSYLDTVLRNAPCDVLVKRIRTPRPANVEAVLVPIAGGPHNRLARETAASICRRNDASATLLHVLSSDPAEGDRARANELLAAAEADFDGVTVERELLESDHVGGSITDRTADHDVTVLGSSEGSLLRRKLLGTVSEAVGRHAAGTVVLAQRHPTTSARGGDQRA